MNTADTLFLSAVVSQPNAPGGLEVRTREFSRTNFEVLIKEDPVVIAVASEEAVSAPRLIDVIKRQVGSVPGIGKVKRSEKLWRLYDCRARTSAGDFAIEFKIIKATSLGGTVMLEALQKHLGALTQASCAVLVPDYWASRPGVAIESLIRESLAPALKVVLNPERARARERRLALNRAREDMLEKAGTLSSEEVATGAASTSSNASQYAADLRRRGGVFGVRLGQEWLYPKFQFDEKHRVLADMEKMVAALSPDEQGWDRLQWFLEPHERLGGKTPLVVWASDRARVIAAARSEHWDGRD
jgi:hypothetical protein